MNKTDWLAPGRRTVEGYLLVVRGSRKESYGLLGDLIADAAEARGAEFPRYQDVHAVWFGFNPDERPGYQHVKPFLRYKSSRPIDGLSAEHNHHRVRLSATIGPAWVNGYGADITKAKGECLDCRVKDSGGNLVTQGGEAHETSRDGLGVPSRRRLAYGEGVSGSKGTPGLILRSLL